MSSIALLEAVEGKRVAVKETSALVTFISAEAAVFIEAMAVMVPPGTFAKPVKELRIKLTPAGIQSFAAIELIAKNLSACAWKRHHTIDSTLVFTFDEEKLEELAKD